MRLKLLVCTLLIFIFGGVISAGANVETPIELVVNGRYIKTGDTMPVVSNGVSYVPLKLTARALGTDAVWDAENGCVNIRVDDATNIALYTDKGVVTSNDPTWEFGEGYTLINSTAYVPAKLVVYMLGGELYWDTTYSNVVINKDNVYTPEDLVNTLYGDNEMYWMSRIIQAESGGEPFSGKIAVGNVILNRVDSRDFPDTVIGVIFDKNQFSPVSNGKINNTPTADSVAAAKIALKDSESVAGDSLFFLNPRIATNNWIVRNRVFYKSIGNHDFYL